MRQEDYWAKFMESGSVRDYLGFCGEKATDCHRGEKKSGQDGKKKSEKSEVKENAGFTDGDRNDHKDNSCW